MCGIVVYLGTGVLAVVHNGIIENYPVLKNVCEPMDISSNPKPTRK